MFALLSSAARVAAFTPSSVTRASQSSFLARSAARVTPRFMASVAAEAELVEEIQELPTNDNDDELLRIRHSSAHVMAMAVQNIYPEAQVTIGPWIDNGFYYDFLL